MNGLVVLASASAIFVATATGARTEANRDFAWRHYPPSALANGEEGTVGFKVDLTDQGRIDQCAITQSSGYPTLDRETCDFIVQYAHFSAVRDAQGKTQRATKSGFVDWRLPPGTRKSATPRMVSLALPPPLICKRTALTGSNLANATRCMTDEGWKQRDRITREASDGMLGRVFCGDHGCS